MAKILLNVELNVTESNAQLKKLQKNVESFANAFNKIEPKKGLTSQLNALAKAINAVARSNEKNAKSAETNAKADEKAAKAEKERALAAKALAEAEEARKRGDTEVARQATETAKQDTEAAKQTKERAAAERELATAEEKRAKAEKARSSSSSTTASFDTVTTSVATSIRSAAMSAALNLVSDAKQSMDETVTATENAVVELQRVLNEDVSDKDISDALYHLAQDYGQTFENTSQLAIKFAQSGKTWTESIQATEAALIALDVAELGVDEASSGLIALMAQYNIEASDLELVIDKLNITADNAAVTTEALIAGLSRTGSTAVQTNLSLNDTIATLTALSKATGRSGESLGTALNALLNYSSKDSALSVFASLSDDMAVLVSQYKAGAKSMLDVWRGVSEEMEHLSDAQADLLDSYFDTAEGSALKQELEAELGDIYNDMSGVYSTANTFRKNYFIALLNNMDEVDSALETLDKASGYSRQELEQYMDTLEARTNALSAKWQEMITDTSWLKTKKWFVTVAAKALDILEAFGGIRTLVVLIGTAALPVIVAALIKIGKEVKSILTSVQIGSNSAGGWVAIIGLIANLINIAITAYQNWGLASDDLTESLTSNWAELKESTAELAKLQREHDELAAKTQLSTEQAEEFKNVQSELVEILGAKANVLAALTQGTEEYTQKLQQLTEEELKRRAQEALVEASSAKNEFNEYDYGYSNRNVGKNEGISWESIPESLKPFFEDATSYVSYGGGAVSMPNGHARIGQGLNAAQAYVAYQAVADASSGDAKAKYQSFANGARTKTEEYIQAQMEYEFYNRLLTDGYDGFDSEEYTDNFLSEVWNEMYGGVEGEEFIRDSFYDYAKGALIGLMQGVGATGYEVKETTEATNSATQAAKELAEAWDGLADKVKAVKAEIEEAATLETKQNAILEAQLKLQEAIAEARKAYVKGVLEDYVDELDEAATLEEKQNAVIEARQKLLEAQHNRNTRVYNAKTGQWEWQANPTDINTAENNLQNAVESLQEYLKNQAVKEIKELISGGNYSVASIQAILDKWLGYTDGTGELESWADGLVDTLSAAIKSGYYDVSKTESAQKSLATAEEQLKAYWLEKMWDEIDALLESSSQSADEYNSVLSKYAALGVDQSIINKIKSLIPTTPTTPNETRRYGFGPSANTTVKAYDGATALLAYDNGGILEGLGGIKATTEPETVLDPEITRKILHPDSNYRFETFAKSLGILFETSRRVPTPQITTTAPVSNNNKTYTINGVPISAETAQRYTVTELFEKMDLFGNDI